jgi:hypothetical protein
MSLAAVRPRMNPKYHRYIVGVMSFKDNIIYHKDQLFTTQQLLTLVPDDITGWMVFKTLGIHHLDDYIEGMKFLRRSDTLEVMKKAVSWYMPDRNADWNTATMSGNPTKSSAVNDFKNFVKRMEVRRLALPSNARDPLTMQQFRAALAILESEQDNFNNYYRYTFMMKFQYHIVGRCDDMGHFFIRDIHTHPNPELSLVALQTKVFWSKNVQEERNCPAQILFGSYDVDYCIFFLLVFISKLGWLLALEETVN